MTRRRDQDEGTDRRRFLGMAGGACLGGLAVGAEGSWGEPPLPLAARLVRAVRDGEVGKVREMVGGDPGLLGVRDEAGRGLLTVALLARRGEMVGVLRELGAVADVHELAFLGEWEEFGERAAEAPGVVNVHHVVGGTAMTAAALGGVGSDVWRVYAVGGEPDGRKGEEWWTALRAAFEEPDLGRAEMTAATLLSNGADPNAVQPEGDSALHAAARRESEALTEMLLRWGADAAARDADGATALDRAEEVGAEGAARWLRRADRVPRMHSTSRRAYDVEGRVYEAPAISHLAAEVRGRMVGAAHFRIDTVRELLAVDPKLAHAVQTTTEGAVEACAHTGQREIVDLLLEHGAPYSLPTAVVRGDGRRVGELLAEDPLRIHERGAHGFPLLWYPVIGGGGPEQVAMAERLLAAGAEVEDQHWMGTTALHWAARSGQEDLARLFLERGGRKDRVGRKFDDAGETPAELARKQGHDRLAALLT